MYSHLHVHIRPSARTPLLLVDSRKLVGIDSWTVDQSKITLLVLGFLGLLAVCVTVVSILILRGGKFYHRIPERSRPRRWFVAIFFAYFITFCLWFPIWSIYPRSIISYVLTFVFLAFTGFIAAWYALGKVAFIVLPISALVQRLIRR